MRTVVLDPSTAGLAEDGGEYHTIEHTNLIDLSLGDLAQRIDWP